jgi:hypothetical protein
MSDENSDLDGFYVIKSEKLIELTRQTESSYYIYADMIQEQIVSSDIQEWSRLPIANLMNHYLAICDLRVLLVEMAAKPTKEMVALAKKYNIKDILIPSEVLAKLNGMLLNLEENEKILYAEHDIKVIFH